MNRFLSRRSGAAFHCRVKMPQRFTVDSIVFKCRRGPLREPAAVDTCLKTKRPSVAPAGIQAIETLSTPAVEPSRVNC